jgi:hypothetical protein
MADGIDVLDSLVIVREDAMHATRSTLDFIRLKWIPETYGMVPSMWVRPATEESLEHAVFLLL